MKIRGIIYTLLFITAISIPLIFCDFGKDRVSAIDNKLLANFPELSDIKGNPARFFSRFNDWFNDSTGFREPMIKLYISLSNSKWLNKVRYKEGTNVFLYGEDGHIYFADTNGWLISKFQGKPFLSDNELIDFSNRIEMINKYLAPQGIPLLFMICPDKETIYPEFYPKSIIKGAEPNQLEVFTNYLKKNTNAVVFNISNGLFSQKENFLLYPKLDTLADAPYDAAHYNQIAAFFGYQELMKYINIYFPQMNAFELSDVVIRHEDYGPNVKLNPENITSMELDKTFFSNINLDRPYLSHINAAYQNNNKNLPVLLFLRDSYTYFNYIEQYIPQHFGKSILLHNPNIKYIKEYLDFFKPDIVIIESGERGLINFYNHLKKTIEFN